MFRSVIATLGAALILTPAALLSPGAVSSAATADDGYPPGTTLYPARLERGLNTPLLHTEGNVIVDRRTRIRVPGVSYMWLLGRLGRSYLLQTADADLENYAVQLVRRDSSRRILQRFGDRTTPVASADGEHLALVTPDRPNTRIRVVKTRTGELVRVRTFASYGLEVADYGIRRMVVSDYNGKRTFWWNPGTGQQTRIVARPAWLVDISANRMVVSVPDPEADYLECQRTVNLRRPSVVLWRSCQDRPLTFSPDGRRMLTTFIDSDGIGPGLVQYRRQDGRVVRTYRAGQYFGFLEWESERRVLLQVAGERYAAAVRCAPARECRRASRLYRVGSGVEPWPNMTWSFP